MLTDCRNDERIELDKMTHVAARKYAVRMTGLSNSGCTLADVPDDLKPGDAVQIHFRLPRQLDEMRVSGAIGWHDEDRAGVDFCDMANSQRIALSSFIIRQPVWSRLIIVPTRHDDRLKQAQ